MATKKKEKTPKSDEIKQEKDETIEMKSLIKDERTHKILGSISILIGFLLFIAFSSYLFTWNEDQDKVIKEGYHLLWGSEFEMNNLMGTFGAYIAHFFIFKGFGIASYLISFFFFVLGINLIVGRKIFSLTRNVKYMVVGLPLISVAAAVIFNTKIGDTAVFPWGGRVGSLCRDYLYNTIGVPGTIGVLVVALLSYIIWRFNPSFDFKRTKKVLPIAAENTIAATDEETEWKADLISASVGNSLKEDMEEAEVKVLPAEEKQEVEFKISEKENTENPPAPPITKVESKKAPTSDVELEIKKAEEPKEESTSADNALQPYDPVLDLRDYKYPTLDLLENYGNDKIVQDQEELESNKNQIINTLKNYDISIQRIAATVGPTVTLYEIVPAPGVRISRIKNLEDDIALSLAALGIRIIAPIPGKGTIGIEVPNARKTIVSIRTLLASEKFKQSKYSLPIALGKKIDNENFIVDLASMPHLLMAGATGQGKSVGLNAILVSLLYKKHPSQLKFVLVDPKKVELSIYKAIEKHFLAKLPGEEDAIITDIRKVINTLNAMCIEMDNRYDLLKEAGCRNIKEYNEKFIARKLNPQKGHQYLPFIVLVVDEFADLIMTAGKEVELPLTRLAQLARAIGIHLIIATQRPSVNIITGTIKANFPARIGFKVSAKIDSRTILDTGGAEQLIGKGDMLISYNGDVVRLQCAFVDTPEVDRVADFIGNQRGYPQAFLLPEYTGEKDEERGDFDVNDKDPLFEDAARLIVNSQSGSTSLLQRRMKLGYNRAGRLMDQLESAGIVGPNQGSKTRDVLIKTDVELQHFLDAMN